MTFPFLPTRWLISPADNADDPDVFPGLAGVGFQIEKTPLWSTRVDTSVSGVERRRQLWSYPVWRFTLGYEYIRDGAGFMELQRLVTFFNMKGGSTTGFFYLDRNDCSVTAMPFGIGDGATSTFQVTRTTTIGGITFTEPVRGFDGTPTFYVNGVAAAATVNALGTVTFTTPPANGTTLTWTGQFYFLCRFEKDELTGLQQVFAGVWDLKNLTFRSFKP